MLAQTFSKTVPKYEHVYVMKENSTEMFTVSRYLVDLIIHRIYE